MKIDLILFLQSPPGVSSAWMIIMIGYDRYNVIVKGFNGVKITPVIAMLMIFWSYGYSTLNSVPPLMRWWGSFKLGLFSSPCYLTYV